MRSAGIRIVCSMEKKMAMLQRARTKPHAVEIGFFIPGSKTFFLCLLSVEETICSNDEWRKMASLLHCMACGQVLTPNPSLGVPNYRMEQQIRKREHTANSRGTGNTLNVISRTLLKEAHAIARPTVEAKNVDEKSKSK